VSTVPHVTKLVSDPRQSGVGYADTNYPGTHRGLLDMYLLVGPRSEFGEWGLGNLESQKLILSIDTYSVGGETFDHSHSDREHAYLVLGGEVEVTIGDQSRTLTEGAAAFIPPSVGHAFRARGDRPLRLLVISNFI
jgi:mannose-6-phosphate isomerase-like protein (cupin superfamily)